VITEGAGLHVGGPLYTLSARTAQLGPDRRCEVCWVAGRPAGMYAWIRHL